MRQTKMMESQNFLVHLQIRLKTGVIKGPHHLNNLLYLSQLPRLFWYELYGAKQVLLKIYLMMGMILY